jgi:hypothetical protein
VLFASEVRGHSAFCIVHDQKRSTHFAHLHLFGSSRRVQTSHAHSFHIQFLYFIAHPFNQLEHAFTFFDFPLFSKLFHLLRQGRYVSFKFCNLPSSVPSVWIIAI